MFEPEATCTSEVLARQAFFERYERIRQDADQMLQTLDNFTATDTHERLVLRSKIACDMQRAEDAHLWILKVLQLAEAERHVNEALGFLVREVQKTMKGSIAAALSGRQGD